MTTITETIDKLRTERDEARDAALALAQAESFNPESANYVELKTRAVALDGRIGELTTLLDARRAADKLDAGMARAEAAREGKRSPRRGGVPALMATHEDIEEIARRHWDGEREITVRIRGEVTTDLQTRALVTVADTGEPITAARGAGLPEPRRLATTVGLTAQPVEIGGAVGPKFGAMTPLPGTPEGEEKPEAGDVSPDRLVPQVLSRWKDFTLQATLATDLQDVTRWLAGGIALDEDAMIIDALSADAGSPVAGGTDPAIAVRGAMALVESTIAAPVDVIICNPADFGALAAFAPTSGADVASSVSSIGGAVLYPSQSASAGTVLVAALRAVGRLGVARPTQTTSTFTPKTNEVTIQTELIEGFSIRQEGGVVAVSVDGSARRASAKAAA